MLNMEKSWIYNLHIDIDISDDDGISWDDLMGFQMRYLMGV